jgi:hypothetical protein
MGPISGVWRNLALRCPIGLHPYFRASRGTGGKSTRRAGRSRLVAGPPGQTIVWIPAAASWPSRDRARRRLDREPYGDLPEPRNGARPYSAVVPSIPVEASVRFEAVQTIHGTSSAGAAGDRETEPASLDSPEAVAGRLVGAAVLLLALSAVWPLPLLNVVPGAIIVLIAIAYLQEDGLLLAVAVAAAFLSLAGFGWTVWTSAGAVTRWIRHSS